MNSSKPPGKASQRLASLDIFRGLTVALMILVNTPGDWDYVYAPLAHSKWNGCTPTDIVFPAFLFIVGVSIVYALQSKKENREQHGRILAGAFRRMLLLIGFGLAIQLFYHFDFVHLRFPGVLQRIGVVYFIVTIMFLKLEQRILDYLFGILLIGYYLIMTRVPVPDGHPPNLEPATNLAAFVDRFVFSTDHMSKQTKYWDPVGLLTTLPAICTTLLGVSVAVWLKSARLSADNKILRISLTGVLCLILGIITDPFFPINKQLWTSSYVLFTGGICTLGLVASYWLIDVRGYRKLFCPFLVFGKNAFTAYIVSEILPGVLNWFDITIDGRQVSVMKSAYYLFSRFMNPYNASLLSAVVFVFFVWLLLYPLFKRNIVIKI